MLLNGKVIFLLEDEPINFAVMKMLLKKSGALIHHDSWGDTTLKKVNLFSDSIDIILLDIMLPGKINGYDVLDAIRKEASLGNIPVVFVSASDPDIEIPKAKALQAQGYISKPIDHNSFSRQIYSILEGEEVWE